MQDLDVNLNHVIDEIAKAKGIDRKLLQETLEQAILQAAKKVFGQDRNIEAQFSGEDGEVQLFQIINVVDEINDPFNELTIEEAREHGLEAELGYGDILKLKRGARLRPHRRPDRQAGDHPARPRRRARQDLQRVQGPQGRAHHRHRPALRAGNNIIVDLGRTEAVLPAASRCRARRTAPATASAYVLGHRPRGPRPAGRALAHRPGLVIKLFEMEVPEIYEGIVRIEAAAREPGAAPRSPSPPRRRRRSGRRLRGHEGLPRAGRGAGAPRREDRHRAVRPDPARFVCNAIAARPRSPVIIDEATARMELIVPDEKLSLAIGRRGQNVRLASAAHGLEARHPLRDAARLRSGADSLLDRKARGEDIRPSVSLPPGYDKDAEWARWPRGPDGLDRNAFDRCVRAGFLTLELVATADNPDRFAKATGYEIERAVKIIYAAREAVARAAAARAEAEGDAEA
jgi:N utilization substance protein A